MSVCGLRQEQIDTVKFYAIHLRCGRELQHGVKVNGRFGAGSLSDHARPHGIVQSRLFVSIHILNPR